MTGQDLLDRCELLNAELQCQVGEADVTKTLLALNVSQDYFESLAAQRGKLFGGSTGTLVTAANTETTTYPVGLLRIDRLQLLDSNSRPVTDLTRIQRTGGHAPSMGWFYNLSNPSTSGAPTGYWTNGTSIYWQPLPSGVSTVRWYGFQRASNLTAAGTLAYDDIVALPLASLAVRMIKGGLDDEVKEISSLALEAFSQALDALGNVNRDGATGLEYTEVHDA